MPFTYSNRKGDLYTLHRTEATLKNGQTRILYFFSRDVRQTAIDAVPDGYKVSEAASGLPILKRA